MQKWGMTELWLEQWSVLQQFRKIIIKTLKQHEKLV